MAGLLFFENVEVCAGDDGEHCFMQSRDPDGNECGSLMQCFISYSYRGFIMSSLDNYLPEPRIAKDWDELYLHEGARLLWEASFTLLTVSMIGAIITGAARCCVHLQHPPLLASMSTLLCTIWFGFAVTRNAAPLTRAKPKAVHAQVLSVIPSPRCATRRTRQCATAPRCSPHQHPRRLEHCQPHYISDTFSRARQRARGGRVWIWFSWQSRERKQHGEALTARGRP